MTDLEELKARNPIADVVQRYGVRLQRSGSNYRAHCPFHDDQTPSLYLYPEEGRFKCFGAGCGLHGDVIDFVGHTLYGNNWDNTSGEQFKATLEELGARPDTGGARPRPQRNQRPPTPPSPADGNDGAASNDERTQNVLAALDLAARVYHENLVKLGDAEGTPLRYLYDRGFTWKTVRDGQFGYCPPYSDLLQVAAELMAVPQTALVQAGVARKKRSGRGLYETFYGRITLTDRDFSYRVVHLIGRKFPGDNLPEGAPKYLSLPDWPKPLYGLESLPYQGGGPVMIVEAPLDMLTLRQWGYDAVAVAGADIKREHVDRLRELDRTLVIVPDNDEAGSEAATRWREALLVEDRVQVLRLPERVGEVPVDDVNQLGQIDRGEEIFADLVRRRLVDTAQNPK